jgi:hypothetical protein
MRRCPASDRPPLRSTAGARNSGACRPMETGMMTLPGRWNDIGSRSAAAGPGQDERAPVSVQRCLSVDGAQQPARERRPAARTQLGMPALTLPPGQPAASERRPVDGGRSSRGTSSAPPRRLPPPLPARFATPKVVIAAAPLLLDTIPARRLQLQDVTCELDPAELLPKRERSLTVPAHRAASSTLRRCARGPRGVRGLVASLLVRLLSLVAPSLQVRQSQGQDR